MLQKHLSEKAVQSFDTAMNNLEEKNAKQLENVQISFPFHLSFF